VIITPAYEISLEKAVQFIKGRFSFRVKREIRSIFPVWQSGYNSHNIQNANDYQKHREYIYDNPVRAGLVTEPHEYPYSSANPKIRRLMDDIPPWLKPSLKKS
jgi:putative transposase